MTRFKHLVWHEWKRLEPFTHQMCPTNRKQRLELFSRVRHAFRHASTLNIHQNVFGVNAPQDKDNYSKVKPFCLILMTSSLVFPTLKNGLHSYFCLYLETNQSSLNLPPAETPQLLNSRLSNPNHLAAGFSTLN